MRLHRANTSSILVEVVPLRSRISNPNPVGDEGVRAALFLPRQADVKRTLLTATFLAGCLCSAFTAARERQTLPHPSTDADTFTISDDEVTRILEQRVDQMYKGVGIVVGLVDRSGTRVISYGTTDRRSHHGVNGDSVFEIGSITKVFTGILLADMVERAEVNLDDLEVPAGLSQGANPQRQT